jgi:calcium permeable stress-gated cation channel
MDLALFITSVLTSFVIFVALVLLFTWLSCRPGNAPVYYPNLLLRGLDPWAGHGRGTRSPGGWLREAISASEPDVVAAGGVDAAVYLVFLSSGTVPARWGSSSPPSLFLLFSLLLS